MAGANIDQTKAPLIEHLIELCLTDGCARLDLLAPVYDYKLDWSSGVAGISDYSVALTRKGKFYQNVYVQNLRPRLQKLAHAGPAPLRKLLAQALKLAGRL